MQLVTLVQLHLRSYNYAITLVDVRLCSYTCAVTLVQLHLCSYACAVTLVHTCVHTCACILHGAYIGKQRAQVLSRLLCIFGHGPHCICRFYRVAYVSLAYGGGPTRFWDPEKYVNRNFIQRCKRTIFSTVAERF